MGTEMNFNLPGLYQILVREKLSSAWAFWFDGFLMTETPDSGTCLVGMVADQAVLHSLIRKIRDLGLTLVSLERVSISQKDDSPAQEDS